MRREIPPAVLTWMRREKSGKQGREWGYVYFITDGEAIKIGWSHSSGHRLCDLQVGNHKELTVLAEFRGTGYEEHEIQRKFSHLNIRGEWFRPAPDLHAFIEKLRVADPLMRQKIATITDVLRGTPIKERNAMPTPVQQVCSELKYFEKKQINENLIGICRRLRGNLEIAARNEARPGFGFVLAEQVEQLRQEAARRD
jgi:hypothetical protein